MSIRFNGIIDDVSIYNHVLTESEIQDLYNAPNPVPEPATILLLSPGLLGLFRFEPVKI